MSYGRFSEEERFSENMACCKEICGNIRAGTEIGYLYFLEGKNYPVAYLHFGISNKWTRKGYQASIGIVVHDDYQNQGIGTTLVKYGLERMRELGYKKVWLHCWHENTAARKLYTNAGFKIEGIFERDQIIDGELKDVVSMAKFLD
jgi:RimJ/RimL family protein N-acetyltransferase